MQRVEIKVWAASAATLLVSVIIAILNAVQSDPSLLGGLPTWLQTLILIILPPVLTWFAGFQKGSTTSIVSDRFRDAA